MKITRTGYTVTFTAEDSAIDNIINKIFSGNTQREMPTFTEETFDEPEAITEQDIFSEYGDEYRTEAYYNAIEVFADEDNVTEPVVVIFGIVNSEQYNNNTTTTKEENTMENTTVLIKNEAVSTKEENTMRKTSQGIKREQDMLNWFYSTFQEFKGLNVDVQLLMKLYEMRLRATECTLNFEQYLHSYCYDLLMYSAGLVDESDTSYADIAVLHWLITEPSAYSDLESAVIILQQADKVLEDISADVVDPASVEDVLHAAIIWNWARTLVEAEEFGMQFGRLNTPPLAASDKYLSPEAVRDLCELFRDRAAS